MLLMMAMLFAQRVIVAVPRRGASCYSSERISILHGEMLLSPVGARAVTASMRRFARPRKRLLSPAGARAVTSNRNLQRGLLALLSPAGARAVTIKETNNHVLYRLLSPAGARAVTCPLPDGRRRYIVAVPRRGASCYGKNLLNLD